MGKGVKKNLNKKTQNLFSQFASSPWVIRFGISNGLNTNHGRRDKSARTT